MKSAAPATMIFPDHRLDNHGNSVVPTPAPNALNRNPELDQIVRLYNKGAYALNCMDDHALRQLGKTLLEAYDGGLTHDSLMKMSFWNDIGGFVDEDGRELPVLESAEHAATNNASTAAWNAQWGKIRHLSQVAIPCCITTMLIYLQQRFNPDEAPDINEDPLIDAVNLGHLINKLPM